MNPFKFLRKLLFGKHSNHEKSTTFSKQTAYIKSHPPRCITNFVVQPVELFNAQFDGHPSISQFDAKSLKVPIYAPEIINSVFMLQCKCGGKVHHVHGYLWANPDFCNKAVFLSPLVLECPACKSKTDLLDTDIHGYDAELGHGSATARGEGNSEIYTCSKCGQQPMKIFVRFEYPDDIFEKEFSDFAGRQQDLFTWFTLLGECPQCSTLNEITDFECA